MFLVIDTWGEVRFVQSRNSEALFHCRLLNQGDSCLWEKGLRGLGNEGLLSLMVRERLWMTFQEGGSMNS